MKKHKICIIGDGLSGLITAQILSKLDVEIHIISKKSQHKFVDNRTTAISPSNFNFLSEHIFKKKRNIFYQCKKVELYHENKNNNFNNFLNFENSKNGLMFIAENKKLRNFLITTLRNNKKIKTLKGNIEKIDIKKTALTFKEKKIYYDMILLCVGKNYKIVESLLGKRLIKEDKKEIAVTTTVKHNFNLSGSRQYFLKEGPMALLPINKSQFSLIWSMHQSFKSYSDNDIRNLITSKLKSIFKKKVNLNLSKVQRFPIYFKFNRNFFKNNIFAIGDSVYNVYPIAGQGFNLVLRDVENLFEKIKENLNLGLQIKDSLIFNNLYYDRKPENFLYSMGINLTQKFFRYNKFTAPIKNEILKDLNRFEFLKKIGLKIADRGIIN